MAIKRHRTHRRNNDMIGPFFALLTMLVMLLGTIAAVTYFGY